MPEFREAKYPVPRAWRFDRSLGPWVPGLRLSPSPGMTSVEVAARVEVRGGFGFAWMVAAQAAGHGERPGSDGHQFLQDIIRQPETDVSRRSLGQGAYRGL